MMPTEYPAPPTPEPASSPTSSTDDKLDRLLGAFDGLASLLAGQVRAPAPAPAPAPAAAASAMASAVQVRPEPAPVPVAQHAQPNSGESFAPGELAYYSYHRNGDPENVTRTQLVLVAGQSDTHVYGLVLGDVKDYAQFGAGVLTHTPPPIG